MRRLRVVLVFRLRTRCGPPGGWEGGRFQTRAPRPARNGGPDRAWASGADARQGGTSFQGPQLRLAWRSRGVKQRQGAASGRRRRMGRQEGRPGTRHARGGSLTTLRSRCVASPRAPGRNWFCRTTQGLITSARNPRMPLFPRTACARPPRNSASHTTWCSRSTKVRGRPTARHQLDRRIATHRVDLHGLVDRHHLVVRAMHQQPPGGECRRWCSSARCRRSGDRWSSA